MWHPCQVHHLDGASAPFREAGPSPIHRNPPLAPFHRGSNPDPGVISPVTAGEFSRRGTMASMHLGSRVSRGVRILNHLGQNAALSCRTAGLRLVLFLMLPPPCYLPGSFWHLSASPARGRFHVGASGAPERICKPPRLHFLGV